MRTCAVQLTKKTFVDAHLRRSTHKKKKTFVDAHLRRSTHKKKRGGYRTHPLCIKI
jgi:hypothetical protein